MGRGGIRSRGRHLSFSVRHGVTGSAGQHLYWRCCFLLKHELPGNQELRKGHTNLYKFPKRPCQLETVPEHRCFVAGISRVLVQDLLHKALLGVLRDFSPSKYLLSPQYFDLSPETSHTRSPLTAPRSFSFEMGTPFKGGL